MAAALGSRCPDRSAGAAHPRWRPPDQRPSDPDRHREPDREELELCVAWACGRGRTTVTQLEDTLARHAGRPGAPALRAIVEDGDPAFTRSPPERQLLAAIRAAGLAEPRVNFQIGPCEVDFYWPVHKLVLELDGYSFHGSRWTFERDHRRDAYLEAQGLHVLRATRAQLADDLAAVVQLVASSLRRR